MSLEVLKGDSKCPFGILEFFRRFIQMSLQGVLTLEGATHCHLMHRRMAFESMHGLFCNLEFIRDGLCALHVQSLGALLCNPWHNPVCASDVGSGRKAPVHDCLARSSPAAPLPHLPSDPRPTPKPLLTPSMHQCLYFQLGHIASFIESSRTQLGTLRLNRREVDSETHAYVNIPRQQMLLKV